MTRLSAVSAVSALPSLSKLCACGEFVFTAWSSLLAYMVDTDMLPEISEGGRDQISGPAFASPRKICVQPLASKKVKKLEIFQNKMGLKGCNWSSLNAPGTETFLSYPYWEGEILPTPIISPLG